MLTQARHSNSRGRTTTIGLLLLCCATLFHAVHGALYHQTCSGKTMLKSGVTCQDQQLILDTHNRLRQSVALGRVHGQPAATHMLQMVWDDELASVAQRWANRCIMAHDHARNVGRFAVGQNIASTWTTNTHITPVPDFNTQISKWFNEVSQYGYYSTYHAQGTGHYSQVVWGDTFLVGCGYAHYYDTAQGYTKLYVCNYGPGGNIVGIQPYSAGSPQCQASGLTTSPTYSGLCEVNGYSALGSSCSYRPHTYYG